jgi:hypothetical protein
MEKAIDYRSLEWMPKSVWGPIKWRELHARAFCSLPMTHEAEWFAAYIEGLPCMNCREHFQAFVTSHPPDFSSRSAFFEWTVQAHNHVNRALQKPEISVNEARTLHGWEC